MKTKKINFNAGGKGYFDLRNVSEDTYRNYQLPNYLDAVLPEDKSARILDYGCGLGQMPGALQARGFNNVTGYEVDKGAFETCRERGIDVIFGDVHESILTQRPDLKNSVDLVIMNHVLEHLSKPDMLETLRFIRQQLLKPGGKIFVAVPNAQSNTGAYWAYEDFTHHYLFTSGSLMYVLKKAGFSSFTFIDVDGLASVSNPLKKLVKAFFLKLYKMNKRFWNIVTASDYHQASPGIFSYEIKLLAQK